MKSGEFKRRTRDDDGRPVYSTFTSHGEPLRATQWGTRKKPKAASWRDEYMPDRMAPDAPKYSPFELSWFAFVRSLPCCVCGHLPTRDEPHQASHATLNANQKGTAMKVPHDQTVPHCFTCHPEWDERRGFCDGWTKEERYAKAADWVKAVREAAIPEDRDQAIAFEQLGIGKVIGDGTSTGFSWLPGPLTEVPPSELAL